MSIVPSKKIVTAPQIRAARGLLGWTQKDLAKRSKVARQTIAEFEAERREPYDRTLVDIILAFEDAGIAFVSDNDVGAYGSGRGVRFFAPEDSRRLELA